MIPVSNDNGKDLSDGDMGMIRKARHSICSSSRFVSAVTPKQSNPSCFNNAIHALVVCVNHSCSACTRGLTNAIIHKVLRYAHDRGYRLPTDL